MKILQIHNRYKQSGGEDSILIEDRNMLLKNNYEVDYIELDNNKITLMNFIMMVCFINNNYINLFKLKKKIKKFNPDIVHVYNYFPQWGINIFRLCKKLNIKTVLSAGNYRAICINGIFLRNEKNCMVCLNKKKPIFGLFYSCYKKSKIKSLFAYLMIRKFSNKEFTRSYIDGLILNHFFAYDIYTKIGFPKNKIFIKNNTITPVFNFNVNNKDFSNLKYLYVGRVSKEKGIVQILDLLKETNIEIDIVGNHDDLNIKNFNHSNLYFHGEITRSDLIRFYKKCHILIFPSIVHEAGVPMTMLEAMAYGLPIITRNIEPMNQLIENEKDGFIFDKNENLINLLNFINSLDRIKIKNMSKQIYKKFNTNYSSELNFNKLKNIYNNL